MPKVVSFPPQEKGKTTSVSDLESRANEIFPLFAKRVDELRVPSAFYGAAKWLLNLYSRDKLLFTITWYRFTEAKGRAEQVKADATSQSEDAKRWVPPTREEKKKSECLALAEALRQRVTSPDFGKITRHLLTHLKIGGYEAQLAERVIRAFANADNSAQRDFIMFTLSQGPEAKGDVLNERGLKNRIQGCVSKDKELRLFIIWGAAKSVDDGTANIWDEKAMENLEILQRRIRTVYPKTSIEIIVADVHAADFAGKRLEDVYRYIGNKESNAGEMTLYGLAKKHGLKVTLLSEIYERHVGVGWQNKRTEIWAEEHEKAHRILEEEPEYASLLERAAGKHSFFVRKEAKTKEIVAEEYLGRRRFESRLFQRWCPNAIFLSFASNREREKHLYAEPIPVVYIYPYAGSRKSDLPWFKSSAEAGLMNWAETSPHITHPSLSMILSEHDPVAKRASAIASILRAPRFCKEPPLRAALEELSHNTAYDHQISILVAWKPLRQLRATATSDQATLAKLQKMVHALNGLGVKAHVTIIFCDTALPIDKFEESRQYFASISETAQKHGFRMERMSNLREQFMPASAGYGQFPEGPEEIVWKAGLDPEAEKVREKVIHSADKLSSHVAMALGYPKENFPELHYMRTRSADLYLISLIARSEHLQDRVGLSVPNALLITTSNSEWRMIRESYSPTLAHITIPALRLAD